MLYQLSHVRMLSPHRPGYGDEKYSTASVGTAIVPSPSHRRGAGATADRLLS